MTDLTNSIQRALIKKHDPPPSQMRKWAYFPEFTLPESRRVDGIAFGMTIGSNWDINIFEIKSSRADFLKEIKTPEKRQPALKYSNRFYFVMPKEIATPGEIPMECGLMILSRGRLRIKIEAPKRELKTFNGQIAARVMWKVQQDMPDFGLPKGLKCPKCNSADVYNYDNTLKCSDCRAQLVLKEHVRQEHRQLTLETA